MSVPTEASSSTYAGNGVTTTFACGFVFLASSEVRVTLTLSGGSPVIQTEGVHYNVVASDVVFVAAPANLSTVLIERVVPFVQATDFRTAGDFSPSVHEDQFDEVVFQTQQLDRRLKAVESAGAPGSVVAGNGLTFALTTLNVGAGAGLAVAADDVSVLYNDAAFGAGEIPAVDAAAKVHGVANRAARSDHKHSVTTAVPVNVTKAAAAEGTATSLARSDHKHDVTTAAAVALTDASNAEGSSASLARADHTHSHGARGGGTLHAVATTSTAGFMSAADKANLDGLTTETVTTGAVKTVDATPTVVATVAPATNTTELLDITVVARRVTSGGNSAGYHLKATVRNIDGAVTQVGTTTVVATHETDAAWDCAVAIASPNANVTVTGAAATSINWQCLVRRLVVSHTP